MIQPGAPVEQETTFYVRVHFRQHASWQGSIQWLEGKKSVFFRSLLEMTTLMLEAARNTAGNPGAPAVPDETVCGREVMFESEEYR